MQCDGEKTRGQLMLPRTQKVMGSHLKPYCFAEYTRHLILVPDITVV
jgi:hypothetical protein